MEVTELKTKMEKAVDNMAAQLRGIRSAYDAGLVDTVKVEQYGQQMPIRQIAQTVNKDGGISIQPHDPNMVGPVITALKRAGYDAYKFSKLEAMVNRPRPSGEDNVKMRAQIAKLGEEAKISIRAIRTNFRKVLEGSEDDVKNSEKLAQRYTDSACKMVDEFVTKKCASLSLWS